MRDSPSMRKALWQTQAAQMQHGEKAYTTHDIDGSTAEFAHQSYSERPRMILMELYKGSHPRQLRKTLWTNLP